MPSQTPDVGGQGVWQRGEAALPGAAVGELALLRQQGAQQLQLRRELVQHREQLVDGMQMPDDHAHQGFQEQPIRVDLGTATPPFRGWRWHRHAIHEVDQHDKQRDLAYHRGASMSAGRATSSAGRATSMMRATFR
ncbi:MAG: hypothetical protein M3380_21755 [Chloroflexota bacterium]|nr:hypothetical protein [Chloroflexota bacterium]